MNEPTNEQEGFDHNLDSLENLKRDYSPDLSRIGVPQEKLAQANYLGASHQ
jgi:hypothetical protein